MIAIPSDLWLALACVLVVSVGFAWLGVKTARRAGNTCSTLTALFAVAVLAVHSIWLVDNILLAKLLPSANLIVLSNVAAPAAGFLAGIAWVRMDGPRWNKSVLIVPLIGIGIWRMAEPFIGEKPTSSAERWSLGVCLQSTLATCSDAAAVTMMKPAGIVTTEGEMSDLCLTRTIGTRMLGLYRGITIKTWGTPWRVHVFKGSVDELRDEPLPAVVSVGAQGLPPMGWRGLGISPPEGRHSVAIFKFIGNHYVDVGDPFVGRQRWTVEQLKDVWRGEAIMLVKR